MHIIIRLATWYNVYTYINIYKNMCICIHHTQTNDVCRPAIANMLHENACICICICIYTCVYIYMCAYVYIYVYIHVRTRVYIYVYACTHLCVYIHQ